MGPLSLLGRRAHVDNQLRQSDVPLLSLSGNACANPYSCELWTLGMDVCRFVLERRCNGWSSSPSRQDSCQRLHLVFPTFRSLLLGHI